MLLSLTSIRAALAETVAAGAWDQGGVASAALVPISLEAKMTMATETTYSPAPDPARQFDFWLGEWDVSWGDQRGTNSVTAILGGAVIQEQFDGRPGTDLQGLSLSVYDPRRAEWRQTWVDSQGNYWAFIGGFRDGRMILVTDDVRDNRLVKLRMVFYNLAADSLDWSWERSDDGGQTWQALWKLHYQRRKP